MKRSIQPDFFHLLMIFQLSLKCFFKLELNVRDPEMAESRNFKLVFVDQNRRFKLVFGFIDSIVASSVLNIYSAAEV